ncbi:MAG: hypothetical protein Ct9H300mP8_01720 [Gammaproteobacteria bacterium]|nr:MAG: hypothetical protein Ct9H300mP8_01720 [Gammaproteobacteria bacterium]
MSEFDDKTVLVTGAAGVLGQAVANIFARAVPVSWALTSSLSKPLTRLTKPI